MNKPLLRTGWLSSLLLAALIPLCVASLSAKAQTNRWYVEVLIDPISKAPILEARILSRMGYRFHITKRDDNSLWADFRVPRQIKKTINLKRLPTYWIDGADPVNLESLKELEVGFKPSLYEISEKRVQFILWLPSSRDKSRLPCVISCSEKHCISNTGPGRRNGTRQNPSEARKRSYCPDAQCSTITPQDTGFSETPRRDIRSSRAPLSRFL